MALTTTQNYLGKCREEGCNYVIFATSEDIQEGDTFRDVTAGTGVYRVNNANWARCTNRHRVFPCKPVKGTYSESHQCDSRCLNAKGWECTCSCGGANHGRGHVATVVQASAIAHPQDPTPAPVTAADFAPRVLPAPAPILSHVGEVGKTNTGEVFVKTVKSLANGSVLYSFRAVNGGHVIKWFCPGYADPGFEVGSTHKIRAEVKRHGEFNGSPETVVTYVEEVE
jgi:hypothetical protein